MKVEMGLKYLLCAFLAIGAPAAMADEFCDDVKAVLAAGDERPAPYDSYVAPEKKLYNGKLASFAPAKAVRGLPASGQCTRYLAGVAEALVGGGTHNYIECPLGSGRDVEGADGDAASKALKATRTAVIAQIGSCLGPSGWTGGKIEKSSGWRLFHERATMKPVDDSVDIVLDMDGRGTRQPSGGFSTSYILTLKIRTPTLFATVKPQ